jgi:hypothetical protein
MRYLHRLKFVLNQREKKRITKWEEKTENENDEISENFMQIVIIKKENPTQCGRKREPFQFSSLLLLSLSQNSFCLVLALDQQPPQFSVFSSIFLSWKIHNRFISVLDLWKSSP